MDSVNTNYLSLPAQVQKNKDDIEALKESGILLTPRGTYSDATQYNKNDLVDYQGSSYLATQASLGYPPQANPDKWQLIAEKGNTGAQGAPGTQGQPGEAATIQVGEVSTGVPGSAVKVTNAGTSQNAIFNFQIPAGAEGATGATGPQGESLNPMGEWVSNNEYHPLDLVSYQGSSYYCTNAINNSTTPPPQDTTHWAVNAAKGDTGAQGSPGTPGATKYMHYITLQTISTLNADQFIYLQYYSQSSTPITAASQLLTNNPDLVGKTLPATGSYLINGKLCPIIYAIIDSVYELGVIDSNGALTKEDFPLSAYTVVSDTVI